MVMRTPTGSQLPQPVPVVNQIFKPRSAWNHLQEASTLYLYLPGFRVGQVRITGELSTSSIRIRGQRPLSNVRNILLDETFHVPDDLDLSRMQTQFVGAILALTIPRKVEEKNETQTQEASISQETQREPESHKHHQTSPSEATKQTDDRHGESERPQEESGEAESEKGEARAFDPKPTSVTDIDQPRAPPSSPEKATSATGIDERRDVKSANGEDKTPPRTSLAIDATKQTDKRSEGLGGEGVDGKATEEKERSGPSKKRRRKSNKAKNVMEGSSEKSALKSGKKENKSDWDHGKNDKEGSVDGKAKEMLSPIVSASREAAEDVGMGLDGDTKLLLNLVAAAFVIMALGAYWFPSFGPRGN